MDGMLSPAVATQSPEKALELERVLETCRASVAREDWTLCRLRIDSLHGRDISDAGNAPGLTPLQVEALTRWWASDLFTSRQRAILGFVEQFVFDVSSMTDEHVYALLATDEPLHVHEIANVVWVLDLVTRMDVVAEKVLP